MLKEERFEIILKKLEVEKNVTYEAFALLLEISEDTVRRDIDYLYRIGLLSKVRGGAMLRSKDPLSLQERTAVSTKEKDVIALKVQRLLKNEMTIFMDGGSTVLAIVSNLPRDIHLRIITNNPLVIPIISNFPNIELIILGGKYYPEIGITGGIDTCLEVNNYKADLYLMGTCAVDATGVTAVFREDAEIKRIMTKCSKEIVALADQNKLRRSEPFNVIKIELVDILVTNLASNDSELDIFRKNNIQIL